MCSGVARGRAVPQAHAMTDWLKSYELKSLATNNSPPFSDRRRAARWAVTSYQKTENPAMKKIHPSSMGLFRGKRRRGKASVEAHQRFWWS